MHDISHAGHLKTVDHEIDESLFGVGIAAFCVYHARQRQHKDIYSNPP
jgi:hypothetical protein